MFPDEADQPRCESFVRMAERPHQGAGLETQLQ